MLPAAAREFYALQQRVNFTTRNELRRVWQRMGDDFDASWRRHGPAALAVLLEAQRVVGDEAKRYVPRVMDDTGQPYEPLGEFRSESLVGRASDGRPLDTLAYGAVTEAKAAVAEGATTAQALDKGAGWLDLMAALQVADVARQAVGVQVASQRVESNYVRVLNPPSCQRCAILAGRVYRWSTGFQRHPRCDCVMMPARNTEWAKAEGFITSPRDAYEQGHIKDLTKAQRQAIDEGADIGKVVNATRGMSTTATETAKSVRLRQIAESNLAPSPHRAATNEVEESLFGFLDTLAANTRARTTSTQPILTPEGIYRTAGGSRDEAVRLLREFGYIA
jgi:predicted DNA-binding WGR domain protein